MDFNFYFLSTTVIWDPLFFWSTSYELWAQHYHQLISLWGTARFPKSTAKRWKKPLKYIVISCQTHRAKPKLLLSACTAAIHRLILSVRWFSDHFVQEAMSWCFSWWTGRVRVQSPTRGISGGDRQTPESPPWSLPSRAWRQVPLSTTPSSHRALRAFMAKNVSIDCVALKQNKGTASGREQAQVSTRARFPKGLTLQVQSPPVRTG